MRRLGIVGRGDRGGIAAQTLAVARNMPNVAAALVLDLGERGRGPFDPHPWEDAVGEVCLARFPFDDVDLDWLLDRCDVVYAPEGPPPWRDDFADRCAARGVEFVIHVNPELWRDRYRGATTTLALPTSWHAERFPGAVPLPMPCDVLRFAPDEPRRRNVLLHVAAPAMDDRNGTEIVRAALPFVKQRCTLLTRGVVEHGQVEEQVGNVSVVHLGPAETSVGVYMVPAATLVLPRRYGGLSLPMLEAAASGMATITLDLPPQTVDWRSGPFQFVPVLPTPTYVSMIGGSESVWDARPGDLATAIDEAVAGVDVGDPRAWAVGRSWERLRHRWLDVLG